MLTTFLHFIRVYILAALWFCLDCLNRFPCASMPRSKIPDSAINEALCMINLLDRRPSLKRNLYRTVLFRYINNSS